MPYLLLSLFKNKDFSLHFSQTLFRNLEFRKLVLLSKSFPDDTDSLSTLNGNRNEPYIFIKGEGLNVLLSYTIEVEENSFFLQSLKFIGVKITSA